MATKAVAKGPATPTLGSQIDDLWAMREEKRVLEAKVKVVEAAIATMEEAVIGSLDSQGVDASRGKSASVSITKTTNFNIADFDAFAKYVAKTKFFHLFQRRVSEVAAREVFELKGAVPGLEPYVKRKLNLRSLTAKP